MLKRFYHLVALLALINLFTLVGLVGFLFATGRLNAERVEQMAIVLRGEFPTEEQEEAPTEVVVEPAPEPSRAEIVRMEDERRLLLHQLERSRRELDDRYNLNQQMVFNVAQALKDIEQREARLREERQAFEREHKTEGFAQVLQVLKNTQPKKSVELLMREWKPADVVEMFLALDTNTKADIVNACKTPEEVAWVRRILVQMNKNMEEAANGVDGSERPVSMRR
ncbi:MAG: hypothetical protein GXY44_06620 [Phycisphaerales bacterium]|nr:hypothetical protein [Phycisphaerales bacterium]